MRILTSCLLFSILVALCQAHGQDTWKQLGTDLYVAQVNYQTSAFFSSQITFVKTGLKSYRPAVVRAAEFGRKAANASALCALSKASVCINASFFDPDGNLLGLIVSRGVLFQKVHRGGKTLTGVFNLSRNRMEIINRFDFTFGTTLEAVQAGPRLISDGEKIDGLRDDGRTKRSGICMDKGGSLIFYATSSEVMGISLSELQDALLSKDINCTNALNLDGGGSSQLFLSGKVPGAAAETPDLFLRGRDDVPVVLALLTKNE